MPFDDAATPRAAVAEAGDARHDALWTAAEADAATGGRSAPAIGARAASRSTAAPSRRAISSSRWPAPNFDGHDFVADALAKGAAAASSSRVPARRRRRRAAARRRRHAGRARSARPRRAAAHRARWSSASPAASARPAPRRRCAARFERQGRTAASAGSLNNQWGVPLSLGPHAARHRVRRLRDRHEPSRRDRRAVAPGAARRRRHHHGRAGASRTSSPRSRRSPTPRPRSSTAWSPRGAAILNRDNPHYRAARRGGAARRASRASSASARIAEATVRLIDCHLYATASAVTASVMGEIVDYCIAIPGRHWVMNSLAVLAAVKASAAMSAPRPPRWRQPAPIDGRGKRHRSSVAAAAAELIDESYNASPASMRGRASPCSAPTSRRRRAAHRRARRHAGTGRGVGELHAELAEPLIEAGVDLVFTVGGEMRALRDALPEAERGAHRGERRRDGGAAARGGCAPATSSRSRARSAAACARWWRGSSPAKPAPATVKG